MSSSVVAASILLNECGCFVGFVVGTANLTAYYTEHLHFSQQVRMTRTQSRQQAHTFIHSSTNHSCDSTLQSPHIQAHTFSTLAFTAPIILLSENVRVIVCLCVVDSVFSEL